MERAIFHVYLAAFPPEVPADRVAALRDAWLKTWKDQELLEELNETAFRFARVSGQETEQVINELLAMSTEEAKRVGKTFGLIE